MARSRHKVNGCQGENGAGGCLMLSTGRQRDRRALTPSPLAGEGWGEGVVVEVAPDSQLPPLLPLPHKGEGDAVAPAVRIRNVDRMSLPAQKARPQPADELPFWRRKAMKDMTPRGVGEPVRRLRPLLPQQAAGGGLRPHLSTPTSAAGCSTAQSCRCTDYANRSAKVKDCVTLTPRNINRISWLPPTCGYRLVGGGQGFVLVASAGVGRPGDGARGRACRCAARWARARSMCRTRIWRITS